MIDTTPILSPDRNPEPERLYSRAQTESVTGTTTLPAGRVSGGTPEGHGAETPAGRVRFSDLTHCPEQREKVLRREAAVLRVQELQRAGMGIEMALQMVRQELIEAGNPKGLTAIRSWCKQYRTAGLDGLVEQKLGVVGRRPVKIPDPILQQARAATVIHGTLGKDGEQNKARAFREVIVSHPDATAEMRERFHSGFASKSYVPATVRRALDVAPAVRDAFQGEHAYRLNSPYTPGDWSAVKAGDCVTGDDMTMNLYAWVEWPNAQGFLVVRPQMISLLDVGSLRWLVCRVIMRPNGQYTSDDVWGVIGDLCDSYGIYRKFLFEGGQLWRGNQVRGHRTGLSNDERFGGLRTFGATLIHARHARSKPIEERHNQFQYAFDTLPGYSGRAEREDCPEKTRQILAEIRANKLHPRGHLLHLSQVRVEVARVMGSQNVERQDGKVLRGMSPDEKWEIDAPKFAIFPESAKWLYRSTKSVTTVRRDGQLKLQLGSGRFAEAFLYRAPEFLKHCGRKVVAYWNQDLPEADCVVLDALTRKFICAGKYVRPMPRLDATPEQFAANAEQLKSYRRHVRAEVVNLAPHYTRTHTIPVDAVTTENGERLVAAREAAEAKRKTSRRVARAVDVDIADDLADYRPKTVAEDPLISDRDIAEIIGDHPLRQ